MTNLRDIIEGFFPTSVAATTGKANKAVDVSYGLETVVEKDLEPASLIDPQPTGPWICGGAPLAWYQGRPVGLSDIDVFCFDQQQLDKVFDAITETGRGSVYLNTVNATTLTYTSENESDTWRIQLIKKRFYNNIEDVLKTFDISVCKIGTDGRCYIAGDKTYNDIHNRVLRMEYPLHEGAAKRFIKYIAYGYTPVAGLHRDIVSNPETTWEFDLPDDYEGF